MYKIVPLFILLQLSVLFAGAYGLDNVDTLSSDSHISVITCDPGAELYSTFGHSAIGVVDPAINLAVVFNYGTFSFNTPHFYAKFASGKLLYRLSMMSYSRFLYEYQHDKRKVKEEVLNLTQSQKQRLFNLLKENYKPENRYYQYDFFFDNCATRITDILNKSLGDTLKYIKSVNEPIKTFRDLLNEYLVDSYWSNFGINLGLGAVIDRPASETEKTFIPDYLSEYINRCEVSGKPLISDVRVLVNDSAELPVTPFLIRPKTIFWFLFVAVVVLSLIFRHKSWIIGDRIIFALIGFTGLIVFLMWVATDHDGAANNWNVLWANPLYLILVWFIDYKNIKLLRWSFITILIVNLFVLWGWQIIPQQLHPAIIPLIGIIIIRSGIISLRVWK